MAFSSYKTTEAVVRDFQITSGEAAFVTEKSFAVSPSFRQDLAALIQDGIVDNSRLAICENLIAPVLKEVWKSYKEHFLLWSHEPLRYDDVLSGTPDYILARRSPLGKLIVDQPYLLVFSTHHHEINETWGQCIAAMIATQRLNLHREQTVFGIVSNGHTWQFGKLEMSHFLRHKTSYSLRDLDSLFAAVNDVFRRSQRQMLAIEASTEL